MEDFQLDIVLGKGPAARSIRLDLPRFTLVGATTRTGLITGPLRDRFGMVARLDYYEPADLEAIVVRAARHPRRAQVDADGAVEIARRARGTPRIANRLLRRVRDFAEVRGRRRGRRWPSPARASPLFGVDDLGLDKVDRAILRDRLRALRRRTRSGCRRWRSASGRSRRRSRTSTSRSSSSRACSCAPPAGGSRPRRRGRTSGLEPPDPRGQPPRPSGRPPACTERGCVDGRLRLRPARRGDRPAPGRAARRGPAARRARPTDRRPPPVADLAGLLAPGDLLVVNDTRVLPARLHLRKATGGAAEVLLLEPCGPDAARLGGAGPARAAAPTRRRCCTDDGGRAGGRDRARAPLEDTRRVRLLADPWARRRDAAAALRPRAARRSGAVPDRVRRRAPGSVAAPTAGLHLTPGVLDACRGARASASPRWSSRVGLDTFRPVTVEDPGRPPHPQRALPGAGRPPGRRAAAHAERRAGGRRRDHDRAGARDARRPPGELEGRTDLFIRPPCASRSSTCSSPTSTCPARACCCWSRRSPGRGGASCTRSPSPTATGS